MNIKLFIEKLNIETKNENEFLALLFYCKYFIKLIYWECV